MGLSLNFKHEFPCICVSDWTILDCRFNMELHLHFGFWHFSCTSHIETAVLPNNFQTRPAFWLWDFPFTLVGNFIQLSPSDHPALPSPLLGFSSWALLWLAHHKKFFFEALGTPQNRSIERCFLSSFIYLYESSNLGKRHEIQCDAIGEHLAECIRSLGEHVKNFIAKPARKHWEFWELFWEPSRKWWEYNQLTTVNQHPPVHMSCNSWLWMNLNWV